MTDPEMDVPLMFWEKVAIGLMFLVVFATIIVSTVGWLTL